MSGGGLLRGLAATWAGEDEERDLGRGNGWNQSKNHNLKSGTYVCYLGLGRL